ncbi:hypothetical protein F2Q70_00040769 [Brassica cretica]|uniref:Uncharacterized protein n=1 Tax=Brassica cretica TaxID=69181 RepID=A0A3N6R921_BRACR|nr:hypothetical protein F2Q70_00040769 [Brassica cretica]
MSLLTMTDSGQYGVPTEEGIKQQRFFRRPITLVRAIDQVIEKEKENRNCVAVKLAADLGIR